MSYCYKSSMVIETMVISKLISLGWKVRMVSPHRYIVSKRVNRKVFSTANLLEQITKNI